MARKESSRIALVPKARLGIPVRALLVALLAVSGGAGVSAQADSGKPKVSIDAATFDWGSVSQGTKVTHDFVVKNSGDIDLVLQRIVPSCGCTATSTSADRIPAGGQASVHVEVDTSGFVGGKEKMVRLFTNDPQVPYSTLTMRGVIAPDVMVEPARLVFPELSRGAFTKPVAADFVVKVRPGSPVTIGEITTFSKFISVVKQTGSDRERSIQVALDPKAPNGEIRDRIVVSLKGAAVSAITVPVIGSVKGDIQLKPATLSFGVIEGSAVISKRVRLENAGEKPVTLRAVETDSDALKARFEMVKPGKIFDIQVDVDPRKVTKDLRATVSVKTDSNVEDSITLAVYGILPPKMR